jgi:large subunit ribosomal protein L2
MTLKQYRPTTPSNRHTLLKVSSGTKNLPLKSRTKGIHKSGGRNHKGKITIRHRGGGHKRLYRKLDQRPSFDLSIVESLEYDPNRSAKIARMFSIKSKKHFYVIASENLQEGFLVEKAYDSKYNLGNSLQLRNMPLGTFIHCIGTTARLTKPILQRSAGTFAQLVQKSSSFCLVRLSSGELKQFLPETFATIGVVSNFDHQQVILGKAGRNRWKGFRPSVRGVAMNPVDHPHGGGEGKSSGGRPSVTPWAKPAHGRKTRKSRK